jgi:wyosine [tRNA(Phe)-imidazoG37] synthetase (radical SAM superfamily)
VSLGINLLPKDSKFCNFDCIYCECGWNADNKPGKSKLPAREEIYQALEQKLAELRREGAFPDAITFAGNGEPTVHPGFAGIIDDTVYLRDKYAPKSKISVLSNATMLHKSEIIEALKKTDLPVLKLDSARDATVFILNRPVKKTPVSTLIEQLRSFNGSCIIQTMFLQGEYNGQTVDSTAAGELDAWEQAILAIRPQQVMIYTIDRDTPVNTLRKVSGRKLQEIAARIEKHGIPVQVST